MTLKLQAIIACTDFPPKSEFYSHLSKRRKVVTLYIKTIVMAHTLYGLTWLQTRSVNVFGLVVRP